MHEEGRSVPWRVRQTPIYPLTLANSSNRPFAFFPHFGLYAIFTRPLRNAHDVESAGSGKSGAA